MNLNLKQPETSWKQVDQNELEQQNTTKHTEQEANTTWTNLDNRRESKTEQHEQPENNLNNRNNQTTLKTS